MSEQEGTLRGRIEAILFVAGEAVTIRELAKALHSDYYGLQKIQSADYPLPLK